MFFTEWNSSDLVKSATSKGKKQVLLTPTTFCLIHATDFADRYQRQLVPLMRAGYIVLCDRYIFTAFARDTVRGCPADWVRGIYNYAALPDLTFFFKADLEISLRRILDGRPQLKYFEAGMDLRRQVEIGIGQGRSPAHFVMGRRIPRRFGSHKSRAILDARLCLRGQARR